VEVMQRKSAAAALEDKLNKAISRQEAAEAQAAAASAVFAGLSLSVSPNVPTPLPSHTLILMSVPHTLILELLILELLPARHIDVSACAWSL
jgi:hypothetical protein